MPSQIDAGLYLPTTYILEGEDQKQLAVRLYQTINSIILALNQKDTGQYITQEFVTGQLYTNPNDPSLLRQRNGYREWYIIGAIGAGITTFPHGLTIGTTWEFVRIRGTASNTTTGNYYPLPFASAAGLTNIELRVNNTDIIITNNSGVTFTKCNVVLEYLKN